MNQLSIIRVKASDYQKVIKALAEISMHYEAIGDTRRANITRSQIENYKSTGNTLLPIGSATLEIIED